MSQKFTFLSLAFIALFSVSASAQRSLTLDGTSGYASVAADLVPTGTGVPFTVECWVLVPSSSPGKHYFVSQGASAKLLLGYDGDNGGKITVGTGWPLSNAVLPFNTWTHIALSVAADNSANLYVNGILSDAAAAGAFHVDATPGQFLIGTGVGLTGFLNGQIDEVRVFNTQQTAGQVKKGMYGPFDPAWTGIAYYKMDEASGNAVNSTSPGLTDATLQGSASRTTSPIQTGVNNALNFAGGHTKVIVPNSGIFDLNSGTIELTVTPSDLTFAGDMIGVRGGTGSRFNFNIKSTGIELWNQSSLSSVPYTFTTGTTYHLAFVCDGVATTVYVDGAEVTANKLDKFGTTTLQNLVIGLSDNGGSDGEPYAGDIDEVRIWSTQRTPAEISNNVGNTLTGDEAGLIALYSFDQGVVGGDNSFLTTVIDNSPNNLHGTAQNFLLTGGSSNFVGSGVTPLPVNFTNFTALAQGKEVLLQWQTAQEQNSSHFIIQHSTDGKTYSDIGSVAAAGNSTTAKNYSFRDQAPFNGLNYYRLKETDLDGKSMYSVVRTIRFGSSAARLSWYSATGRSADVVLDNGASESYVVADLAGHIIKKGQLSSGKLHLDQLPAGVYIVNVITRQQTQSVKLEIH
jgi:hypothetical protein